MAIQTVPAVTDPRELALLKAVGLDKLKPEERELALNIATRYDLDLLLKHLVLIDGRAYITRDGLLHIAHGSGQLDGIETSEPVLVDGYWRATCSVYRKDMSRPFTYAGRYPESGRNKAYAPEMAVKVAECMSLRRAFDVAAPTAEERWDTGDAAPPIESAPRPTLKQLAEQKAAEVDDESASRADGADSSPVQPYPAITRDEFRRIIADEDLDDVKFTLTKSTTETLWPGRTEALDDSERAVLLEVLRDRAASK